MFIEVSFPRVRTSQAACLTVS